MKKLFSCKLLSMLLALTLLFAGTVSLKPTQKANAEDSFVWASFWESSLMDLNLAPDGDHICFIINKDLLMCGYSYLEITTRTTIEDLNDMVFFQEMARCLGEKIGESFDLGEIIDTTVVFNQINMDIVVRIGPDSMTHSSVNILTGESGIIFDPASLEAKTSTDEDSVIFGLGYVIEQGKFYTLLSNLYNTGNYARYSYHAAHVDYNPYGLPITIEQIPVYLPQN